MTNQPDGSLVVLGGGGHASDVVSIIEALGQVSDVIVADDGTPNNRFVGRTVRVSRDISAELIPGRRFVSGVGYPKPRTRLTERAFAANLMPAEPLVHPSAVIATAASIGAASVVGALCYVSALAQIGDHCYLGYGSKVGHDSVVGDYSSLMPGCFVGGDTRIGVGVLVGANATVLQGVSVGDHAVVGAGAVVLENVDAGATVVGNPARVSV